MDKGEPWLHLTAFHTPEAWNEAGVEVFVSKETHPQNARVIRELEAEAHLVFSGSLQL